MRAAANTALHFHKLHLGNGAEEEKLRLWKDWGGGVQTSVAFSELTHREENA